VILGLYYEIVLRSLNRQISTPYKINTPEPIDKKIGTVDYVREGTPIQNLVEIHPLSASGQVSEI